MCLCKTIKADFTPEQKVIAMRFALKSVQPETVCIPSGSKEQAEDFLANLNYRR
jgi:hypothetical protein